MSAAAEVVTYPGAAELEQKSESIVALAQMYVVVNNPEELAQAENLGIDINAAITDVHKVFDPVCQANYNAWKTATDTRGSFLAPLESAKRVLSLACGDFRRREREERERKEAEIRAQLAQSEQQRRLEIAADLEKSGDTAAAAAVLETALDQPSIVPSVSLPAPPKTSGASYRDKWVGRVLGEEELFRWVMADFGSRRQYVGFDQGAINATGQQSNGKAVLPGVVFENTGGMAFSRKGR